MELEQIKDLIAHLEASKLSKLVLRKADFELQLEKPLVSQKILQAKEFVTESAFDSEVSIKAERGGNIRQEPIGTYIKSPMVGTFYTSSAPDQPPFVKVGDKVHENSVVCIVEAMKVMNEVKAGVSGTVAEIVLDNAQPVEFGTGLFRIV